MRFDLDSLIPPPQPGEKFSFEDPAQPGQVFEVELRPLDWLEEAAAMQVAEQLTVRYVTGGWIDERGIYQKQPEPLFPVGDHIVTLSQRALKEACMIAAMQVVQPGEEPYDALWFCRFALVMPNAWADLQVAARTLSASYAGPQKKTPESTWPSSTPVSGTDKSTPDLPETNSPS